MPITRSRRSTLAILIIIAAPITGGCNPEIFGPDTPTTRSHVTGTVTSAADGSPVAGALVYPFRSGWTVYSGGGLSIDTAVTDRDGRYVLDTEHYCPAFVGARAEDYLGEHTEFWLGCQGTRDARLGIELKPASWGVADYEPAWSPDGAEIAYSRATPTSFLPRFDLFVTDTLGTTAVVTDNLGVGSPSWSPDGLLLAFTSGGLHVVGRDGSGLREVSVGDQLGGVAWSPTGDALAYWTLGGSVEAHVYVVDTLTLAVMRLTQPGSTNRSLSWSPDGSQAVFVRAAQSVAPQIYRMESDGSGIERLTELPSGADDPAWSPCGDRIAFTSFTDGSSAIHLMEADGSDVRVLTDGAGQDRSPTWSPDCTRIAFSSDRSVLYSHRGVAVANPTEIWIVEADGTGLRRVTRRE